MTKLETGKIKSFGPLVPEYYRVWGDNGHNIAADTFSAACVIAVGMCEGGAKQVAIEGLTLDDISVEMRWVKE